MAPEVLRKELEKGLEELFSNHLQVCRSLYKLDNNCNCILTGYAGLWGLAGYPLSGIRRTLLTSLGKSQEGQILLSRISQGHDEMKASSAQDRMEVVRKWAVIEESLKEKSARRCRSRMSGHEHNMSTTTATA